MEKSVNYNIRPCFIHYKTECLHKQNFFYGFINKSEDIISFTGKIKVAQLKTLRPNREKEIEFWHFAKKKDFSKKLQVLLNGLSKSDQDFVKLLISRLHSQFLYGFDFRTPQERKIARATDAINKCGATLVNGFKFKNPNYETSAFVSKIGLGKLSLSERAYIKDKSILDVGAYYGDTAFILSEYTNKPVFAFEPTEKTFDELCENIALNNLQNKIIPYRFGLSDKTTTTELHSDGINVGMNTINPKSACHSDKLTQTAQIQVKSLDSLVKENPLGHIGLIKVDIEGHEQNFLKGARKTIIEDKPILLISIYHNVSDFFNIKPLLEQWGYTKFKIVKTDASSSLAETMLIAVNTNIK